MFLLYWLIIVDNFTWGAFLKNSIVSASLVVVDKHPVEYIWKHKFVICSNSAFLLSTKLCFVEEQADWLYKQLPTSNLFYLV